MKPIALAPTERVIAVVPEYAGGPGWANSPLWVYIAGDQDKALRTVCIQPEKQTPEMHALFAPGAAMHRALVGCVVTKAAERGKR